MKKKAKPAQIAPNKKGSGEIKQSHRAKRRIVANTGAMAGSSLWRILVSFLLQLLVARFLGIEAHGRYTVALAYLNVAQILTELGLQNLLVRNLARQDEDRQRYFTIALMMQIGASILVWMALWGIAAVFPYSEAMRSILWLVGASLPFYAVTISCQTIFQASERMELVMVIEVIVNTLIGVLSLLILYQQGDVGHLIGLLIATQALSALLCLYLLFREKLLAASIAESPIYIESPAETELPIAKPGKIGYLQLLRESMPFYGLSLADVLLQRLDILLLSIFAGEAITGLYSAAYNIIRVLQKLTQSYWKALFPTLSRLARQSILNVKTTGYEALQRTSLKYGLVILLGAATVIAPAGELILSLIYGTSVDAEIGATVLKLLIWSAPFYLYELYAITILMAEDRPGLSVAIMSGHLVAVALLLPSLTAAYGAEGAGWAVLGATAIGMLLSIILTRRTLILKENPKDLWWLFPAILTSGFLYFVPFVNLIVLMSGFLLYLVLVWLCGIVTVADVRRIVSA